MNTRFDIHSTQSTYLGTWAGDTPEAAVRAMLADAGDEYGSETGGTVESYIVTKALGLWIENSGAATVDIERGVAAAEQALTDRGLSAAEAWDAAAARADDRPHSYEAAEAWDAAEAAALSAAFDAWARIPEAAILTRGRT